MALPKTFVDLSAAFKSPAEKFVNIIGVVVDIMPPTVTATAQHMFTFKLLDRRLHDSIYGNEGLRIRFFKGDPQSLPKVQQCGDVVLLRNVKMTSFNQQPLAMSNWQTEVTVFPAASIPAPNFELAFQGKQRLECLGVPLDVKKLSLEEQSYVIQLKHEMSEDIDSIVNNGNAGVGAINSISSGLPNGLAATRKRSGQDLGIPEPKKPRSNKKVKLIKELQHRDFADLFVQVVKKFPTNHGTCELYVTDYTENKEMFFYSAPEEGDESERDGDSFGYTGAPKRSWQGPYGQLVLKVDVMDPHAHYANRELEEGDFVLLKNVRIKVFSHLEGNMWPDDRNREEVKMVKLRNLTAPEILAIMERKEKYWVARDSKLSRVAQQSEKKKLTNTEKKKQKKQRKAEQDAAAAEKERAKTGRLVTIEQNGSTDGPTKADVNPHVRCSNDEVPISSIRTIHDSANDRHSLEKPDKTTYILPFTNVKYRARVRVGDFEPKQLEDFAVPELLDNHKSENSPIVDYESSPKYEWSFSLRLEDASKPKALQTAAEDQIWVHVAHTDAQYLFGNDLDDPSDLRNDPRLLSKLREKLCILWGNLEEKSDEEQISNRPFECCLAEYGIEMDNDDLEKSSYHFGFQKMYSMFGVTIL